MNEALQIIISAVDQASSVFANIGNSVDGMKSKVTSSIQTQEESFAELNKAMGEDLPEAAGKASLSLSDIGSTLLKGGAAITAFGGGITAIVYSLVNVASDAQAKMVALNTTIDDSLSVVNDAAKGHGFLA